MRLTKSAGTVLLFAIGGQDVRFSAQYDVCAAHRMRRVAEFTVPSVALKWIFSTLNI
jgi:hypothetical protein